MTDTAKPKAIDENEKSKIEKILKVAGKNVRLSGVSKDILVLTPALTFKRQNGTDLKVVSVCLEGERAGQVSNGEEWLSADYIAGESIQ